MPPPATAGDISGETVSSKKPRIPSDATGNDTPPAPAPADFEGSLAELEAIVDRLEQGELSLDESLQQFERGVQLTRACQAALKQAEHKVEVLLRKSASPDEFETAPFAPDDDATP